MKNFRLLRADEIECRVAQVKQNGLSLLLYKDARCDQDILDETVGMMNWQKSYEMIGGELYCTISIWDADKKQWISKTDVGTESNTEATKGRASDAQKRAAFAFGLGRELYSAPFIWVKSEKCNIESKGQKPTCYDKFKVARIGYDEQERINDLQIINDKTGEVVYEMNNGKTEKTQPKKTEQNPKKQDAPVENAPISATKQKAIVKFINDNGLPEDFVWAIYKVKDASGLTESMHSNIIQFIDKIKERYQTVTA